MAKKTTPAKRSTALADTAAAATEPSVGVAAEFEVGTIVIPISAADLQKIKENGLQFSLPPGDRVNVGSISEFVNEPRNTPGSLLETADQAGARFAALRQII